MQAMNLPASVMSTGELPLLGHLAIMQTPEAKIRRDTLNAAIAAAPNLPNSLQTRPSRADYAFKRATSKIANTRHNYAADGSGNTVVWLVRDVFSDKEQSIRHLIREVRDTSNKRLSFDAIAGFTLYKPGTAVMRFEIVSGLDTAEYNSVKAACDLVKETFDDDYLYIPQRGIYNLIDSCLTLACASGVARQVNFIPERGHAVIQDLFAVLSAAYAEAAADSDVKAPILTMIPLIDTQDQRITVARALAGEVANRMVALNREITQRKEAGTLTGKATDSFLCKIKEVRHIVRQYKDLIDEQFDTLAVANSLLDSAVETLINEPEPEA